MGLCELLSERGRRTIRAVVQKMQDMPLVACAACRYCCEGCPVAIAIPDIFWALSAARLYPGQPSQDVVPDESRISGGKARMGTGDGIS